jgi:hypothetical protein
MNPNLIILKRSAPKFFSKRKTTRDEFKIGLTTTYIMMLLFIWILWIYYVWSLNVNATNGYMIRKSEIERKSLIVERDWLNIKTAELESLTYLEWETKNRKEIKDFKFLVRKDWEQYVYNDIK